MAHLQKSATSGHLLKGGGGHLVKECGVECDECGADTPSSVDVTWSADAGDICFVAGTCYNTFGGSPSAKVTPVPSSGSATLTRRLPGSYPCVYDYWDTGTSMVVSEYSGSSSCSGTPTATTTYYLYYRVTFTNQAGALRVSVRVCGLESDPGPGTYLGGATPYQVLLFSNTDAPADCLTSDSVTDELLWLCSGQPTSTSSWALYTTFSWTVEPNA